MEVKGKPLSWLCQESTPVNTTEAYSLLLIRKKKTHVKEKKTGLEYFLAGHNKPFALFLPFFSSLLSSGIPQCFANQLVHVPKEMNEGELYTLLALFLV